jgi:hypothetical protein
MSVRTEYMDDEAAGRGAWLIPDNLTTDPMSPSGPKRHFAAVQRYGRYRWNTGRSVDAAGTAAPDPERSIERLHRVSVTPHCTKGQYRSSGSGVRMRSGNGGC